MRAALSFSPLSIFLVGMMGAGKSTVGARLARRLEREFIDVDRELEARLGVDIPTVFDLEGEEGFRRRESQLVCELAHRSGLVVATGGGVVLRAENREALAARGLVVYLKADAGDLWQRLRRDRHRPLLRTEDPRQRVRELVEQRDPLYLEVADHVVGTGRQPADHAVESIVAWLARPECAVRARLKAPAAGLAS
ncbi:MAG: shikimate kinase [Burkholderiaceae bacterium]|nr:shikimate kinase [Burkholderiaceae bacterium]